MNKAVIHQCEVPRKKGQKKIEDGDTILPQDLELGSNREIHQTHEDQDRLPFLRITPIPQPQTGPWKGL